jgi:glycerophosphoryl diester phosphodiesterase
LIHDFTLTELKTLDAGRWFSSSYAGARIQTLEEVLDWARGRTTVLAELKDADAYEHLGIDLLSLFDAVVRRTAAIDSGSQEGWLTMQSFHEPTVVRAGGHYKRRLPVVLLRDVADALQCGSQNRLAAIAGFATGLGPEKSSLVDWPQLVDLAHRAGLHVTPWTFRVGSTGPFESLRAEMGHYLHQLDVDGVITDNPDQAAGVRSNDLRSVNPVSDRSNTA